MHRFGIGIIASAAALAASLPSPAVAASGPRPSSADSFGIGNPDGVLCRVQAKVVDPAIKGMFDRAWSLVCRDAAAAVGHVYALRTGGDDPLARLAAARASMATCAAPAPAPDAGLAAATVAECSLTASPIGYRAYSVARGRTVYVAEGLAGYDSALELALRSVVEDRVVPGTIKVAVTAIADPAAFARVQAGSLDLDTALQEGYRRNNSGSYAEAAEFFDTLLQRAATGSGRRYGEYLVNRALQKSNLGAFDEADALFQQAAQIPSGDPVELRLRRNFYALHLVNQRKLDPALAELDRPLAANMATAPTPVSDTIDAPVAAAINSGAPLAKQLGISENAGLTPEERVIILDAQALQIRGTILRLKGDPAAAETALAAALGTLTTIREGRIASIVWLRAQTMAELSAVAEARGDQPAAEKLLRDGVALLATEYPGSAALNASKARLAAYLARQGQAGAALALYKEVVEGISASGSATTGYGNLLAPYFALMARELPNRPGLVDDFFLASETLVRPGVADTQAILARELSGGSDEAARLFRQAINLTRDVERNRVELARLSALDAATPDQQTRIAELRSAVVTLQADQIATQAKLGQYPRYNAVSTKPLTLAELREALRPDEAYVKLAVVGDAIYGIFATQGEATAYRTAIGAATLDKAVDAIRDTISKEENGELLTYAFDVKRARALYVALFGPVDARLKTAKHLVFEPDGAMLRLPANLLVTEQAGVDAYEARQKLPKADDFDFRGIAWLGKQADVSTAVSARGFRDVRRAAPSAARREYLGLGQNAPVSAFTRVSGTRGVSGEGAVDCSWPLSVWDRPIKPTELFTAEKIIGANESAVVTGAAFSDSAIKARTDLTDYRILHFATHGLVTAPRPECPARPALLTSFGDKTSDGLLTFSEIYDLRLDADLVILSACDTAGQATVSATREAGVTSGGGAALDGLVRAFVGAGSRVVIASHWPAPDDYRATERLISGLFDAPPGTGVAAALHDGQVRLMDAVETSHPYYWADFAVIGDGAQPVLRPAGAPPAAPKVASGAR